MKEKLERTIENENEIGVNKQDTVNFDETLEVIKEIDREYNKKLLKKLILLYGKSNAISIYNRMKQEGDKELQELFELSKKSDMDNSMKL